MCATDSRYLNNNNNRKLWIELTYSSADVATGINQRKCWMMATILFLSPLVYDMETTTAKKEIFFSFFFFACIVHINCTMPLGWCRCNDTPPDTSKRGFNSQRICIMMHLSFFSFFFRLGVICGRKEAERGRGRCERRRNVSSHRVSLHQKELPTTTGSWLQGNPISRRRR